jgi:hypothetical protein
MLGGIKYILHFYGIERLTTILLVLALVATGVGYAKRGDYPTPDGIDPALHEAPKQTNIERSSRTITYHGVGYIVEKVAEYEITGLVASHNNIHGFTDIYHDETSLDTKDVCLVWGENLKNTNYLKASFKNAPWMCHVKWKNGEELKANELSNNHLITASGIIRDQINSIRKGDQIRIRGMLVNYRPTDVSQSRISSINRIDKGNGACEIILVDWVDIIKSAERLWYTLYEVGLKAFALLLLLRVVFYFWL